MILHVFQKRPILDVDVFCIRCERSIVVFKYMAVYLGMAKQHGNSSTNPSNRIVECCPLLNAINSASVVLIVTSVCTLEAQAMGQPANVITNLVVYGCM